MIYTKRDFGKARHGTIPLLNRYRLVHAEMAWVKQMYGWFLTNV